jgi:hypothetical protein
MTRRRRVVVVSAALQNFARRQSSPGAFEVAPSLNGGFVVRGSGAFDSLRPGSPNRLERKSAVLLLPPVLLLLLLPLPLLSPPLLMASILFSPALSVPSPRLLVAAPRRRGERPPTALSRYCRRPRLVAQPRNPTGRRVVLFLN